MSSSPLSPIIGIDLGTTNSLVAVADWPAPSPPRIIPDSRARSMLPSVVRFDDAGNPVELGYEARAGAVAHPLSTVFSVKRLMGRSLADAAPDLNFLPYRVVDGPHSTARIALPLASGDHKVVSPQEVSAVILRTLRDQASRALGVQVSRAVITVPAYFDDAQRQATRDAGRLAGLDVVRIVNEPTAAALAYGLGLRQAAGLSTQPQTVVVFDLGGGTFDVSILRITPGSAAATSSPHASSPDALIPSPSTPLPSAPSVSDFFQVLSTAGDTHLGGDDFDQALIALFTREINQRFAAADAPISFPVQAVQALRQFAESAKIRLSEYDSAHIRIDLGPSDPSPSSLVRSVAADRIYDRTITRAEFESLIAPLVDRAMDCCRRALRDARRAIGDDPISAVVLVGGSTRTPLVRARVQEFFSLEPYTALNPDEVVALGAAVQAATLAASSTPGSGPRSLLLDVVPLSLGIETVGGAAAKLIVRNSTVPARAGEMFSTSVDNQTGISLHVLQGEREMASDCRSLGRFELKGIPPMPAGIPKLRVEFLVDASGILTVHAVEERSGKRLRAQIIPNHGLTQDEVDRLERESFLHARDDMTRHRIVDLIANSRLDLHWISRQMQRLSGHLPPDLRADIDARTAALRALVERADADWRTVNPDEFHAAKDALDKASIRLHEISIARSLQGP